MIDTLLHGGLSLFYLAIMAYATDTLRHTARETVLPIRGYARAFLILTASLAGTFAVIQGVWVLRGGFGYWPEPLNWMWLIFDACNGLAYVAFVGATRTFLLWRPAPCFDEPTLCPRRYERTAGGHLHGASL